MSKSGNLADEIHAVIEEYISKGDSYYTDIFGALKAVEMHNEMLYSQHLIEQQLKKKTEDDKA